MGENCTNNIFHMKLVFLCDFESSTEIKHGWISFFNLSEEATLFNSVLLIPFSWCATRVCRGMKVKCSQESLLQWMPSSVVRRFIRITFNFPFSKLVGWKILWRILAMKITKYIVTVSDSIDRHRMKQTSDQKQLLEMLKVKKLNFLSVGYFDKVYVLILIFFLLAWVWWFTWMCFKSSPEIWNFAMTEYRRQYKV